MQRGGVLGLVLLAEVCSAHAAMETVTVQVPGNALVSAFSMALQGSRISVDNFAHRHRVGGESSRHVDASRVRLFAGEWFLFTLPEYRFKPQAATAREWAFYVSDLNSSDMTVNVEEERLRLVIRFESQGAELKVRCLQEVDCRGWEELMGEGHLDAARLTVTFTPMAWKGGIGYRPLSLDDIDFQARLRVAPRLCAAEEGLCEHLSQRVYPSLGERIRRAMRDVLNDRALRERVAIRVKTFLTQIQPGWRVQDVTTAGSVFQIAVRRPPAAGATRPRRFPFPGAAQRDGGIISADEWL